jgi:hypothetical protein
VAGLRRERHAGHRLDGRTPHRGPRVEAHDQAVDCAVVFLAPALPPIDDEVGAA